MSLPGIPAVVSLVTLGVDDLASSTAFYRALGWELSSASVEGEVSFFRTAGGILALWGRVELAADGAVPAEGSGFRCVAFAVNVGSRQAVDDGLAIASAAGGTITRAAQATDWGGYNGYFADPEGNLWEVAHNPHWPLDERGLPALP